MCLRAAAAQTARPATFIATLRWETVPEQVRHRHNSDLAYRSKYLDLVKEKAEEGVLDKTDYAILNDRVLMEEGKPQIYGTQIKMAATIVEDELAMQLCLWPVEYPAALDSLRSTVGLSPIEEYLKTSSESIGQEIVWDKEKTVADFD